MAAQRGQIVDRGPNTHLLRVYLGRDENGKRKYANKTVKGTISDARKALTKMLGELDMDTLVKPSKLTVQKYLEGWLDGKSDVEPKTMMDYNHRMKKDVIPFIGGLRLDQLNPGHVRMLYGKLKDNQKRSPRTIRYTHTILSQALELAVEDGLLGKNPCKRKSVREVLPKKVKTPPVILTPDECSAVIAAEPFLMRRALWRTLLLSGMRPQEVLALKWDDLRDGAFHICRALHEESRGKEVVKDFTKTDGSVRTVDLDTDTLSLLQQHRQVQAKEILKAGEKYERNGYVFATRTGTTLMRCNVRRWWDTALTAAGLPERKLYTTRHTHLSHLLENGENPKAVAERAGHKDPSMLLRTYAHTLPGAGKKLATAAAGMLLKEHTA